MDTWIGDWIEDKNKLKDLTEQRAVEDVWAMHYSPDYTDREMKYAMKVASKHLGLDSIEFIALLQVNYNAYKVS